MSIPDRPLAPSELERLTSFLATDGGMSIHAAEGLLVAVATAPEMLRPSTWLSMIIGDRTLASEAQAGFVSTGIMRLYNDANERLRAGRFVPLGHPDVAATREWAAGYSEGVALDSVWSEDEGALALVESIVALAGLADLPENVDVNEPEQVDAYEAVAVAELPEVVAAAYTYFEGGRRLAAQLLRLGPTRQPARTDKVGRNAACPCGSGKKFKKCCGAA